MRSICCAVVVAVMVAGASARGQVAPSSEEIHRLMDEGQYAQALQKISAGLGLKGGGRRSWSTGTSCTC